MNIVFHHPLPLNTKATSASGIRPLKMLAAFESLGYKVDVVTGYSAERKEAIDRVKRNVKSGVRYAFVYAESSTMPTTLTDPHHLPTKPLLDLRFFQFCKKNAIPIGLFYRDIYWLFESYGEALNPLKKAVAKAAYKFDLWVYQRTLTRLYLPSIEMGKYVPRVNDGIMSALPPGHTANEKILVNSLRADNSPLKLFYVGGMSSHYQFHKLVQVVSEMPEVQLTICTREAEWQAVKSEYLELTSNIQVIHETGEKMEACLHQADIAVLFVQPHEYREFASPVKLYEYLGFCKPVLASEGTLSGTFVRNNGIGWTLPYEESALKQWVSRLIENRSEVSQVRARMEAVAVRHTWEARAKQVIQDLTQ